MLKIYNIYNFSISSSIEFTIDVRKNVNKQLCLLEFTQFTEKKTRHMRFVNKQMSSLSFSE